MLDDRFISAKHLRVTRRGTRFLVLDHASTNGTWLGPVRLFEAEVPLYTWLRVGETELLLEPRPRGGTAAGLAGSSWADTSMRQLPSSSSGSLPPPRR